MPTVKMGSRLYSILAALVVTSLILHYGLPSDDQGHSIYQNIWKPSATIFGDQQSSDSARPGNQYDLELNDQAAPPAIVLQGSRHDQLCATAPPESQNIMVVFKTGAAVLENRLPAHLLTVVNCVPPENLLIFSDVEQDFGGHHIYDALRNVSQETKTRNPDFKVYKELQDLHSAGVEFSKLKGKGSWDLDKWKFLPVTHAAYAAAPSHIDWFIFLEGDSSISWLNTLLFLKRFDPKKDVYLGSPNHIGPVLFAHGGSGTFLSRGALDKLANKRATEGADVYDARWDDITSKNWAGDCVLSQALQEVGVRLTASWPVIQGESVASQDYTRKHWCCPPATMHHVRASEISAMWDFETAWVHKYGWSKPYLWRDVFNGLIADKIHVNRTSWNNLSKQRKIVASYAATAEEVVSKDFLKWDSLTQAEQMSIESPDNCAVACQNADGDIKKGDACLQWAWKPGRCYLGSVPQYGHYDDGEKAMSWTSGWLEHRLAAELEARNPCPKEVWNR